MLSGVTRVGVTRVGVTRGGKWMVSPYFFFQKTDDLFRHRLWRMMAFLAVVSLPPRVTPSRGDIRLKLISVALKFRHKNKF